MNTPNRVHTNREKNADNIMLKSYFIIVLVAFSVFANSLSSDFVFDDESVVLGDQSLTHLSSIPKYFTAQEGFFKVIARYYRPVVSTSYNIDYAIWGLKPAGFHLTNVLINIINSLLVFRFLLLIFGKKQEKRTTEKIPYIPLFGALIFAVHTVHTEAVSWVSGRTDSLSFTFFIASFIYYLKYSGDNISRKKSLYLILTGLFYILSLLSKEMAITLPAAIILYDLIVQKYPLGMLLKSKLKIYSVLIFISLFFLLLRWYILRDIPERETYFYFYGKDFSTTFFTMLQAIPIYLKLMVFPIGLLYHYNGYLPYVNSLSNMLVILAILLLLFLGLIFFYYRKKHPLISFSVIFFFLTLLPVLNIVPTLSFLAERFLYIPSLSLILILVYIAHNADFKKFKTPIFVSSTLIILLMGILTIIRNNDWKDNDSLFLSADDRPGTVTYVNIANMYAKKQQYDIAEKYYRKALDLKDETVLANNNLAKVLIVEGKLDSAYYYVNKAKNLDSLSPEPRFTLAQLYISKNLIPDAVDELESLHKIMPGGYMNSKEMLEGLKQKLRQDSTGIYSNGSKIDPAKIIQMEQDSYKKFQKKDYEGAVKELLELVELNPSSGAAYYNNLGMCFLDQNNLAESKKYFELAVKADKKFSTAFNNLGNIYEKLGDKTNALKNYKSAIDTDPNNKSAQDNFNRLK